MPLRYLLDEHLRGVLLHAVHQHNARGVHVLDVLQVGDPPGLPLGSKDPDILLWAERENRVLVTRDVRTLPTHLTDHLKAGRRSPGVLILRPKLSVPRVVAELALYAHVGDPLAIQDRIEFIP
jgi:hypothetical protein